MDVLEAIQARRSVRNFRPDGVSRENLEQVINAGRLAPSAFNDQPWEFVVVTNVGTREQLAAATDYGKFIADAPACIVVLCTPTAHHLEDGSAAVTSMLIAATGLRLGTCWVAGAGKPHADTVKRIIQAPDELDLIGLIAVGYSDDTPTAHKRPLGEVVHWEKY